MLKKKRNLFYENYLIKKL